MSEQRIWILRADGRIHLAKDDTEIPFDRALLKWPDSVACPLFMVDGTLMGDVLSTANGRADVTVQREGVSLVLPVADFSHE